MLFVGPPDRASSAEIFRIELRAMAHNAKDVTPERLAEAAPPGLSGAEIAAACREAAIAAMEEDTEAEQVCLSSAGAEVRSARRVLKPRCSVPLWCRSSGDTSPQL
jgi:AAA family ATPase